MLRTWIRVGSTALAAAAVVAACAPPAPQDPPPEPDLLTIPVTAGFAETGTITVPDAAVVLDVAVSGAHPGLELHARVAEPASVVFDAVAAPSAGPGRFPYAATATYCNDHLADGVCPGATRTTTIAVEVHLDGDGAAAAVDGFRTPAPQRFTPTATPGILEVPDQLTVLTADGTSRAEVEAAIHAGGGTLVGADDHLGAYEALYPTPDAATAAAAALTGTGLFNSVATTRAVEQTADLVPRDWDDDGESARWPYETTGATHAWDVTQGSHQVKLGLVDMGIWHGHPDLAPGFARGHHRALYGDPRGALRAADGHGTHVAAIMCAPDGNSGLVGVMHDCALHGFDIKPPADTQLTVTATQRLSLISKWVGDHDLDIVNFSIRLGGNDGCAVWDDTEAALYEKMFAIHRDVLFVTTAGNCPNVSADAGPPSSLARQFDHVLSVSATAQRGDGQRAPLASYSAVDGEIAAPGGDHPGVGFRSAGYRSSCEPGAPSCAFPAPTWVDMAGTSMAAPFVAGTAGLMLAANPSMTATQLAHCLQSSANVTEVSGTPGHQPAFGLREVRVDVAVACADALSGAHLGRAVKVAAGAEHTCALSETGRVSCWGDNGYGQVGNGRNGPAVTSPQPVAGLGETVDIAVGNRHSCALSAEGAVRCWGLNFYGALGDGTTTNRATPVPVVGLDSGVRSLHVLSSRNCALLESGTLRCWGLNSGTGRLGVGVDDFQVNRPLSVIGLPGPALDVALGSEHTCTRHTGGWWCWGDNTYGQLGDGTFGSRKLPGPGPSLDRIETLWAGAGRNCARLDDDTVHCWGRNAYGYLGADAGDTATLPVEVPALAGTVEISGGNAFTMCGRNTAGAAHCWGSNNWGSLGAGTGTGVGSSSAVPVPVVGLNAGVRTLANGSYHGCAVLEQGAIRCWGRNQSGQLGMGRGSQQEHTPVPVVGFG